jgi:hypothetical protein
MKSECLSTKEVDSLLRGVSMESNVIKQTPSAYDILSESKEVLGERAAQRDCKKTGERSMAATVAAFNALTGHTLTEGNGWEFMCLLKMVRGRQGDPRKDDYVDLASYGALLGECRLKHG